LENTATNSPYILIFFIDRYQYIVVI